MPTIYAKLPFKEPKPITVEARNGRAIRQAIRDGFAELKSKRLTTISFEGYFHGELSDAFFAKHSSPSGALLVKYSNSINNIFSSLSDSRTFTYEGYMVELARRLKVSPKIYVRECYEELWSMYIDYEKKQLDLQINYPQFIPHVYLTGTPGIGKTAFLPYFIHRLLKDKRQVIFGSRDIKGFIYWKSLEDYIFIIEDNIDQYLSNPDIFFVMDSRDIASTLGPCVICSSPRSDIAKQFRKTAKTLFMPVWDWHEIQTLHQLVYPDIITKDCLASRFYLLGGVPRYLLERIDVKAANILKSAVEQTEPSHLQRLHQSEGSGAHEEVSHRLIHQDSMSEISLKYASLYVSALVVQKHSSNRRDQVVQWLDETSELGKAGGLRGNLFEDIGHCVLKKGGDFRIRNLDNNGPIDSKSLSAKQLVIVAEKTHELATKVWTDQFYYKPLSKTFECIDSWVVINGETWGFQFTVSKSHKLSTAVYWLFEHLNLRHYVTVVYDEAKFKGFSKTGSFSESKKAPFSSMLSPPKDFKLNQYVMIIDGSLMNFEDLWSLKKAEFMSFVSQPWTSDTQGEYDAAFE